MKYINFLVFFLSIFSATIFSTDQELDNILTSFEGLNDDEIKENIKKENIIDFFRNEDTQKIIFKIYSDDNIDNSDKKRLIEKILNNLDYLRYMKKTII